MNKQEIEHQIKRYETVRGCAEERLNELNIQLRDLCEPEKPKLRHGDFGIHCGKGFYLNDSKRKTVKPMDVPVFEYENQGYDSYHSRYNNRELLLGNIFDLTKGWSEPFKEYGTDKYATGIKIKDNGTIGIYACTGQDCKKENFFCGLSPNEAKEFHNALGHAIADLKRKENK